MPLQNRVNPFGDLVAVPERGTFMGNRGCLHDSQKTIKRRRWASKAWIICVPRFKDRRRELMTPGSYTELFFLDEATAMAAGHRPCAECRRTDAMRFKALWHEALGESSNGKPGTLAALDTMLHSERIGDDGTQRRWPARLSGLPDGVMVAMDEPGAAFLVRGGALYRWSAGGYLERRGMRPSATVAVLTPPSTARVLTLGYRPVLHASLDAF